MKKLESSLKNMAIVLTGVTVVAGALLGYVNELTKGPIAEAKSFLSLPFPHTLSLPAASSNIVFAVFLYYVAELQNGLTVKRLAPDEFVTRIKISKSTREKSNIFFIP